MTSRASSPLGDTERYEPTSPRSSARASTIRAAIPALWSAMAVTGPATPAPTMSAFTVVSSPTVLV
jgi:hypothetical protein